MGNSIDFKVLCAFLLTLIIKSCSYSLSFGSDNISDYISERQKLLEKEFNMKIGSSLVLSDKEVILDVILMKLKQQDIHQAFKSGFFPPASHFFQVKDFIQRSKVYEIIRMMPKGAALHLHDSSMVNLHWLISKATYLPNCYMCYAVNQLWFKISNKKPPHRKDCLWTLVSEQRRLSQNSTAFDEMIYNNLSMIVTNPYVQYPDQNSAWRAFENRLAAADGLIFNTKMFKAYHYEALEEMKRDNVQYIEFRGLLPSLDRMDGNSSSNKSWILSQYREASQSFVQHNPDSLGSRFIYSSIRSKNTSEITKDLKVACLLYQQYPDYFLGYDLVGQEDRGHPLIYFINELLTHKNLPYFFHAGETDWIGTSVDQNILDAILLNTTRIGHGYAITKHPLLLKLVKEKMIPLEINPISNQVLGLVRDLRNHPASMLISDNYPLVISSDDPAVWGATGLSFDFYQAFMGLAGESADLRFLKQLALNSIRFSALPKAEKQKLLNIFNEKWKIFLDTAILKYKYLAKF